MEVEWEAADKSITKITTSLADMTLDPEGNSLNPAALPSELSSLFEDVQKVPCLLQSSADYLATHPEDPNVWKLRYLLVEKLEIDLEKELDFVGELAEKNAKNYLMWHHRRCIAKKLGTSAARNELKFTEKILSKDAENYHAWDHRQWIFQAFDGKWSKELGFSTDILMKDKFNPFAWNQRWFVLSAMREKMPELYRAAKICELNDVIIFVAAAPENQGAWTYLRLLYDGDLVDLLNSESYLKIPFEEFLKHQVRFQKHCKLVDPRPNMNKRGCQYVLDLISEVLDRGCYEALEYKELINDAFPGWLSNYRSYKGNFDAYWNEYWNEMIRKVK